MWSENLSDYYSNPYYHADPAKFVSLLRLTNSSGRWIGRNLERLPDLMQWICASLPLLRGSEYSLTTKLIWIFSGRTRFPKCETCMRRYGRPDASTPETVSKRRCCESNGIEIMYADAYEKYVKYCENRFGGKFWYRQFRNK